MYVTTGGSERHLPTISISTKEALTSHVSPLAEQHVCHVQRHFLSAPQGDVHKRPSWLDAFETVVDGNLHTGGIEAEIDALAICKVFGLLDDVCFAWVDDVVGTKLFGKFPPTTRYLEDFSATSQSFESHPLLTSAATIFLQPFDNKHNITARPIGPDPRTRTESPSL